MDEWLFYGLLHNLPVKSPVGNNYISVAPPTDPRVEALRSRSPAFCQFVDGFKDQFQQRAQPGLLLRNRNISPLHEDEDVLAFRNALAISSITQAWQNYVGYGNQLEYLKYSNYFDIYPYTLAKDEQLLRTHTASMWGGDDAERFQGQTSPELAGAWLRGHETFYDEALFAALLDRWVERYVKQKTGEWSTHALFRSLDMAYRASAMPQLHRDAFGTNLALWVSAFEILVHPGTGRANLEMVLEHLGKAIFLSKELGDPSYTVVIRKKSQRVNFVQKTYDEMYSARNDFLHGNPVRDNTLFPAGDLQYYLLTTSAVLVYKCALLVFLGMFERLRTEKGSWRYDFESTLRTLRQPREGL